MASPSHSPVASPSHSPAGLSPTRLVWRRCWQLPPVLWTGRPVAQRTGHHGAAGGGPCGRNTSSCLRLLSLPPSLLLALPLSVPHLLQLIKTGCIEGTPQTLRYGGGHSMQTIASGERGRGEERGRAEREGRAGERQAVECGKPAARQARRTPPHSAGGWLMV